MRIQSDYKAWRELDELDDAAQMVEMELARADELLMRERGLARRFETVSAKAAAVVRMVKEALKMVGDLRRTVSEQKGAVGAMPAMASERDFDLPHLEMPQYPGEGRKAMNKKMVATELLRMARLLTGVKKQKYRGYTIEESGMNFYVVDPSGHRAFGEVPASVETAKKWIDMELRDKGRKAARAMLVLAKSLLGGMWEAGRVEGDKMRLVWGNESQGFILEEMPEKGKKRLRVFSGGWNAWVVASQKNYYRFLNLNNIVEGIHSEMSYEQAKALIVKNMEKFADEAAVAATAAGDKQTAKNLMYGPRENEVHYLTVEPPNVKPFVAKGKDFTVEVKWTEFKAYSPDSDFNQTQPFYSYVSETAPAGARKLFKMLSADPNLLKSVGWMEFTGWLDKNGVSNDTHHSQWN